MPSPFLFNIIRGLSCCSKVRKSKKGIEIGKGEIKLPLLTTDMIVYIGNLKESTEKILE